MNVCSNRFKKFRLRSLKYSSINFVSKFVEKVRGSFRGTGITDKVFCSFMMIFIIRWLYFATNRLILISPSLAWEGSSSSWRLHSSYKESLRNCWLVLIFSSPNNSGLLDSSHKRSLFSMNFTYFHTKVLTRIKVGLVIRHQFHYMMMALTFLRSKLSNNLQLWSLS